MITRIEHLKDFGIFQDFTAGKDLSDFKKYNLLYGWNGSGKSTLSKLLATLEHKKMHEDFTEGQFKIGTPSGVIQNGNVVSNTLTVRVFNQDFIRSNIKWEEGVKSILLIAEDKIEDRKRLDQLNAQLTKDKISLKILEDEKIVLDREINQIYSASAKTIKESFKIIDTSDKYYFNYDKTKFERFLADHSKEIWEKNSILTEKQKEEVIRTLQPVEKDEIQFELTELNSELYKKGRDRIKLLLQENIVSKSIERLKEHPAINAWVKEGLDIHKKFPGDRCEYCDQLMPADRTKELSEHFSESYRQMLEKIDAAIQWLVGLTEQEILFPDAINFYSEFQEDYLAHRDKLINTNQQIANTLAQWQKLLESKKATPFTSFEMGPDTIEQDIVQANELMTKINSLIQLHNAKTKNFEDTLKKNKAKLELHYAAELVQQSTLKKSQTRAEQNVKEQSSFSSKVNALTDEIKKLSASLINEEKGADQFNKYLHKFLGRSDISLRFDKTAKGYQLLRGKKQSAAKNLSEGEKTAIAFVYFVIKLNEGGNDIEKTIVVVDDPISSFDSNHLFHSYSFLKNACDKAAQLFVFTHNFQYFRLIRDWFETKNKNAKPDASGVKVLKSAVFAIESNSEDERNSSLKNAHDTLQKYNSEYHYVFHKLHKMSEEEIDNLDKAYLVGNLCRKMLEGFLSFKYPKARNDFRRLMEDSCNDKELLEKIYKFINKYSHNQLIEFHDTPIDNLLAEGKGIIKEVFQLMNTLDNHHYKEMQEICN